MVEHAVDVPALESGVLASVDVELNQPVLPQATIARLDSTLADLDVQLAKLQHVAAKQLAEDDSNVKFHQVALDEAQEELSNFESISTSVSGSELRRLKMAVGKARLALIRTQQERSRAAVEAQLRSASVDAAQQRLDRRQIKAPLGGIVTNIHKHPGQWVEAGEPVFHIRSLDHLIVDCLIPMQAVNLSTIQGAQVRVDALKDGQPYARLSGTITSYDHEVSSRGFVRFHAKITNLQQDGRWVLLPGMNVRLHIPNEHINPAGGLRTSQIPGNPPPKQ